MAKVYPIFSNEDKDLIGLAWRSDRSGYARMTINNKPKPPLSVFSHHLVAKRMYGRTPDYSIGEVVDHINRNRLDNRRENIRIVPSSVNAGNRGGYAKYVVYHKSSGKYQVQIPTGHHGQVYVTLLKSEEEALRVANRIKTAIDGIRNMYERDYDKIIKKISNSAS